MDACRHRRLVDGLPAGEPDDVLMQSSIITTLNAKTAATQRLGVKPEAKLRTILEISNALARTLKLDDVLRGLLDGLFKVFPQADTGFVVLTDREDGKSLMKGLPDAQRRRVRLGPHLQHDRPEGDGERRGRATAPTRWKTAASSQAKASITWRSAR